MIVNTIVSHPVSGRRTVTGVSRFQTRIFEERSWNGRIGDTLLFRGHR